LLTSPAESERRHSLAYWKLSAVRKIVSVPTMKRANATSLRIGDRYGLLLRSYEDTKSFLELEDEFGHF